MRIRVARSGRKHRIGNAHILEAMINAGEPTVVGDQLVYVGPDDRSLELEVIAVPDDSGWADLTVIHAMPETWRTR